MNMTDGQAASEAAMAAANDPSGARLGELLVGAGKATEEDVAAALERQRQHGGRLGELLVGRGVCTEEDVLTALAGQLGMDRLDDWAKAHPVPETVEDLDLMGLAPAWWRSQRAVPLLVEDKACHVALSDPLDVFVPETVARVSGRTVQVVLASDHELRQLLAMLEGAESLAATPDDEALQDLATGAPVVRFVNDTIQRALDANASDIHFETYRGVFRVRFRVDGVLHEVDRPGMGMQAAVISRLKLMAGLDIAEKRLPQDGRIRLRLGGRDLDIRVATSPGIAGEHVVLRLLASSGGVVRLDDLAMHADHRDMVGRMLAAANGIILVTGPTGSGKSTSLYAFLRQLLNDERKIITVEDPVEYQTPGMTQISVNPDIGLTFASVLRSVLRQDPDVILVGEIRDRETARIAVQAALTGHLVFSTLHTNDAPSAFVRLMDMGVEPYLLASSVIGVVAQRLVRRVCPECARSDAGVREQAEGLGWVSLRERWPELAGSERFVTGEGCPHCLGSGYFGRRSIFEMFEVDEVVRHALATGTERLREQLIERGMRTLREDGLLFAGRGETTVAEVLRVTE